MNRKRTVAFPDELIEDKIIELTLFPSNSDDVGVTAVSSEENSFHILRIFQLLYSPENEVFEPYQEMAAFSFETQKELKDFLEKLPGLNGIEMLMLLHPIMDDSFLQN